MNQTLEETARALFQFWFVDFDPIRAKMDGRWRRGHSLLGMPAGLYDLFPDRLVDSELGEIPAGWEVVSLPEFIDFKEGPGHKALAIYKLVRRYSVYQHSLYPKWRPSIGYSQPD